jgi:type III secretion system FlhB-like substrate exporter
MSAPKVVAKGAGLIALRIREIGTETACRFSKPRWRVPCTAMRILDNRSRDNSYAAVAGAGMAVETLASGWRSTACET